MFHLDAKKQIIHDSNALQAGWQLQLHIPGEDILVRIKTLVLTLFSAVLAISMIVPTRSAAQTEQVLHSFTTDNGKDGFQPFGGLILDKAGNLYGTTPYGGDYGAGTVFELMLASHGWSEMVLHSFNSRGGDGWQPSASLIFDASGNLYGTTYYGGAGESLRGYGGTGTVFKLVPQVDGSWSESIVHSFLRSGNDGAYPLSSLVIDRAGNLYGTTEGGGANKRGTVFELTPQSGRQWSYKVLHNFGSNDTDGVEPTAGLAIDAAGNLYGTTILGGTGNCDSESGSCGTVFEVSRKPGGGWEETLLHSFDSDGTDGIIPVGGVTLASGHLYGSTNSGGAYSSGTVFELSPATGGSWTETVIHSFNSGNGDGYYPEYLTLVFDAAGNIYGTTTEGGVYGNGIVFELSSGAWQETVLHSFYDNGVDGWDPVAGVTLDSSGDVYGTTQYGGTNSHGTVFEITP
jgi:uncharacterized repeat protein (TIGR03803 family)